MTEKEVLDFDTVILGGGPAGMSAAIYTGRGELKTAIIDISMFGGQPSNYLELENYPGFGLIGGFELMEKFEAHADKFGVEKFSLQEILDINLNGEIKTIETGDYIFKSKTIIIATGAKPRKLGIKGEQEFLSRGVSYCAVCDGAFYKDKVVAVIGGGNAAVEEGAYLTKFAKKVYIIHRRDTLRADKIAQQRAFQNEKVEFIWDSVPVEIQGDKLVEKLIIKNVKTDKFTELEVNGVFPYIGFSPNVEQLDGKIEQDEQGFICCNANLETNIDGVFVAGDVRVTPLRQVVTAAADGAVAGCAAVKYLENQKVRV
ncbi:thioredoxin-disulfide reductase [bacterium]|nr:thioredoxin-disulfide reductase [bacterium]